MMGRSPSVLKELTGDVVPLDVASLATGREVEARGGISQDFGKYVLTVAQLLPIGIGNERFFKAPDVLPGHVHLKQLFGMADGQRFQHY